MILFDDRITIWRVGYPTLLPWRERYDLPRLKTSRFPKSTIRLICMKLEHTHTTFHIIFRLKINEPHHAKQTKWVGAQRRQISLGIRPVWSESSLCAQWVAKGPSFLNVDSEDSGQTGWTPRLIWGFAGRIIILLVLSCRGSNGCLYRSFKLITVI